MEESTPEDRIIGEFKKDVEKLFGIPITESGYGYNFHTSFGSFNRALKKSKYFIDSTNQTYFHLTSYRNLFSIINYGKLRLYNLSNSDDKNELNSYEDAGFNQTEIKKLKEDVFILSCCHESDIENKELWRNYGKIAIIFEIINSSSTWKHFHLSKIYYERNNSFEEYSKLIQSYERQYPNLRFSHESLRNLIAFHKIPALSWEREVRLMYLPFQYKSDHADQFSDFKTSEHHTGYTKYIELPLYTAPDDQWVSINDRKLKLSLPNDYFFERPQIKIKSVKFGDNEPLINQEKFDQLHSEIELYLLERFGYKIEVDPKLFITGL